MKTVTVASQKGGSGKSTVTTSASVCAMQAGLKTAILDTDKQITAYDWGLARQKRFNLNAPFVINIRAEAIEESIIEFRRQAFDIVFIDTPGIDSCEVDMALRVADLTILPLVPSPPDLRATRVSFSKAQMFSKQCFFLLNKLPAQGSRAEEARVYLASLTGRWLSSFLSLRVDYMDAYGCGLGVTEYNGRGAAAREIAAVWNEILAIIK